MPGMKRISLACVLFFLASCGGGGGGGSDSGPSGSAPGSCDLRGLAAAGYCQEYAFDPAALSAYETNCTSSGGTWIAGPCPHAMSLGGCRRTEVGFGDITNWFYEGGPYTTADEIMTLCVADGVSTYVAP